MSKVEVYAELRKYFAMNTLVEMKLTEKEAEDLLTACSLPTKHTPYVDHNALDKYVKRLRALIADAGVHKALSIFTPGACGCMGPRDGEPFCVCRMHMLAIDQLISITAKDRSDG
jgi:hypothetical protein